MSPKEFASKGCANYSKGICLGVGIRADLNQYIESIDINPVSSMN